MAYFIALGILALLGIGASAWLIRTDGYGRIPTDPRRLPGGSDLRAPREETAVTQPTAPTPTAAATAPLPTVAPARVRRAQRDATARA